MAELVQSRRTGDLYAQMAPEAEAEPDFWLLRRQGVKGTSAARRTFRYFGLRLSAFFFAVSGSLGVWLLGLWLGADLAWLAALPLPAYACLALGVPALFELIRPPREESARRGRFLRFLFTVILILAAVFYFQASSQMDSTSKWLIPGLLYGVPLLLGRFWARRRAETDSKPKSPSVTLSDRRAVATKTSSGKSRREPAATRGDDAAQLSEVRDGTSLPTAVQFAVRTLGLSEAVFWLLLVGAFPPFLTRLYLWPADHLSQTLETSLVALLFLAVAAVTLGIVGTASERLVPRFPRLTAFLIVFGPFALSLVWPAVPNLVSLAISASHLLLSYATSGWGLI
jgi:hypothetical protein